MLSRLSRCRDIFDVLILSIRRCLKWLRKDAPVNSLKGKSWTKLLASGKKDEFRIDGTTVNFIGLPGLMKKIATDISDRKSIAVTSSITIPLLKAIACGLSPEGQLWLLKILSDPSEHELVYSFPFAASFEYIKLAENSLRRDFETYVISRHFETSFDITSMISGMTGNSSSSMEATLGMHEGKCSEGWFSGSCYSHLFLFFFSPSLSLCMDYCFSHSSRRNFLFSLETAKPSPSAFDCLSIASTKKCFFLDQNNSPHSTNPTQEPRESFTRDFILTVANM